jgi:hypothetical protein
MSSLSAVLAKMARSSGRLQVPTVFASGCLSSMPTNVLENALSYAVVGVGLLLHA